MVFSFQGLKEERMLRMMVVAVALSGAACGVGADSEANVAPAELVADGQYSDQRFIDMMAAHHRMAVEMANMAKAMAEHTELRDMALAMVTSQSKEIEHLKQVRQRLFGSEEVPTAMHPHDVENSGMAPMSELHTQQPFDKAFIDSMIPHHAGAVRMASVAVRGTADPELREMARVIIDVQAHEIGKLMELRSAWYPAETPRE
jgi:uncharacterized protein (DUF305 family)